MARAADDTGGEGVLDRMLRVLDCFSEDEPELTAAELSERTGLASSTLHRLLAQLVTEQLLGRAAGHRYTIGVRLWELGELSPLSLRLRETALPHMARLYEATGENVHLAVLSGATPQTSFALYVGRITGRGSIATLSRMGGRGPLHATGVGKALLSARDEAWLEQYFEAPRERETVHTVIDEDELRAEIAQARLRGYAHTREEMTLGNISVAAPLGPVEGMPPIALGVVVHLDRADERRLGPLVVQASRDLQDQLRGK
ncbi:IclR family transcriptional regulator [Microbacter sp. GSS18]|nr:IclR family transcriptional regulator [Microbacter sp. GSS18]